MPDTFEIIYRNQAARELSGGSCSDPFCFSENMGRDDQCPICPVRTLIERNISQQVEIQRKDGICLLAQASQLH